jgi:hypothetical protein
VSGVTRLIALATLTIVVAAGCSGGGGQGESGRPSKNAVIIVAR